MLREFSLAHKQKAVVDACQRSDLLDQRRPGHGVMGGRDQPRERNMSAITALLGGLYRLARGICAVVGFLVPLGVFLL